MVCVCVCVSKLCVCVAVYACVYHSIQTSSTFQNGPVWYGAEKIVNVHGYRTEPYCYIMMRSVQYRTVLYCDITVHFWYWQYRSMVSHLLCNVGAPVDRLADYSQVFPGL